VPVVLLVTTSRLPPHLKVRNSSFPSRTLKAERAGVEPAGHLGVGREQVNAP
jgi:hypothetical protein